MRVSPGIAVGTIIGGLTIGITLAFALPAEAASVGSNVSVSVAAQPSHVPVSQSVTVSVTVRNSGSQPSNVNLNISSPSNLTYVSSDGCGQLANAVQCNLNSVHAGSGATVTIQLRATQPGTGWETVRAYAGDPQVLASTASTMIIVQGSTTTPATTGHTTTTPSTSGSSSGTGSGSQVSRIPSGPAQTGGGSTAVGSDLSLAVAGGSVMLAGGAMAAMAYRRRSGEALTR